MQVRVLVIEDNHEMDDLVKSVSDHVFEAPAVDIRRYPPAYGETALPDIVLYDVGAVGVPEYVSRANVAGLLSDHPGVPVVIYSGLGPIAEYMAEDLRAEYPDALIYWCAGLDPVAIRNAARNSGMPEETIDQEWAEFDAKFPPARWFDGLRSQGRADWSQECGYYITDSGREAVQNRGGEP